MLTVRPPCVAGYFYPGDPNALMTMVEDHLDAPMACEMDAKAVVAPHAGYVYSGPIAGTAYASLRPVAGRVRRVVLLGPAHRYPLHGMAVSSAHAFDTPLGRLSVDQAGVLDALALPGVAVNDVAFEGEHSLEVHLPFLQRQFGDVELVPVLVGEASPEQVEHLLDRLWGGPETLIVVSSDLSHFHDYAAAQRLDGDTSRLVETLRGNDLTGTMACGYRPLAGLLRRAAALDLRATTLDLRNSGDTAGSRDRVVGYGAFLLEDAATAHLSAAHRDWLRDAATAALQRAATGAAAEDPAPDRAPAPLRAARRTFVTLEVGGRLRGCVGSLAATDSLIVDVARNTRKAALSDPRFPPLTTGELSDASVTISVLSTPRPIAFADEDGLLAQLRPGIDGMIIEDCGRRALFLPKVWAMLPDPRQFLGHLKAKAGLSPEHWSDGFKAWRFTTECI